MMLNQRNGLPIRRVGGGIHFNDLGTLLLSFSLQPE
jgi:hypothetical protein